MRTGSGTKGTRHYDWAMLEVASDDTPGGHGGGHSVLLARRHRYSGTLPFYRCWTPGSVPLSRLLRDTVIPPPRRDRAHRLHWSTWRRRHQHRARQAHRRWNAYAETTP
jgi:hypothetical protein